MGQRNSGRFHTLQRIGSISSGSGSSSSCCNGVLLPASPPPLSPLALAKASSSVLLLCGCMLLLLALISLTSGPLLELDRTSAPVPIKQRKVPVSSLKVSHKTGERALAEAFSSENIWTPKLAEFYHGCSSPTNAFAGPVSESESNGYVLIQTSGGLNQQRTGIIDAVVVARILNATLVVPQLDHKSFWKDSSNFSDIFDVDWFIAALVSDIPIVRALPAAFNTSESRLYSTRVPRKCTPEYFKDRVLPILQKKKVIRLTKFDYRLSNRLDDDLQKLRCRVNYNALRFPPPIKAMGEKLVDRLRKRSGRYIALHLRFEPDMLAFSGCYYGGGDKEVKELGLIRRRWKTLHQRNPERERRNGKCPLTPEEVGLMLRALGFGADSHLYVASGEVYGGESTLAPLRKLFPYFHTKDNLATKDELQPFSDYSSRLAAIDYIVCDESDVFVTNNNGNMARILAGRRRYFGHKRTIRPNARRLGALFLAKPNMTWDGFAFALRKAQRGYMGEPNELTPGRGQFFENPSACICEIPQAGDRLTAVQQQGEKRGNIKDGNQDEDAIVSVSDEEDDDQDDDDLEDDNPFLQQGNSFGPSKNGDTETEDIALLSD